MSSSNWPDGGSAPGMPPRQPSPFPQFPQPLPPQWQQQPLTAAPGNGLAVAGFVLGVTSIIFCWLGLLSLVQVVLAIVFSGIGISRANKGARRKGMATAGLILGGVGFLLYLVVGIMSFGVGLLI